LSHLSPDTPGSKKKQNTKVKHSAEDKENSAVQKSAKKKVSQKKSLVSNKTAEEKKESNNKMDVDSGEIIEYLYSYIFYLFGLDVSVLK